MPDVKVNIIKDIQLIENVLKKYDAPIDSNILTKIITQKRDKLIHSFL